MERIVLSEISPRAWEHPADRAALKALKDVPGLRDIMKFFIGMTGEKSERLKYLGSSVRVNKNQFPKINALADEACRVLDLADRPEIYVTQNPLLNAGAVGGKRPFVVLFSSMLDTLDEDETLAVIAHEIGHIMSGHVLYKSLLRFLVEILRYALIRIPVAQLVLLGVLLALLEWDRKSELTADRAGLLVVQNPTVSKNLLMKLAGGKHIEEMNLDEFVKQAEEYESGGDVLDGIYKVLNELVQTHPHAVVRLKVLTEWVSDGGYDKIIGGEYERRTDQEQSFAEDFAEASKQYQDDLKKSQDPFAQTMSNIGEGLDAAGKEAAKFFESIFGKK